MTILCRNNRRHFKMRRKLAFISMALFIFEFTCHTQSPDSISSKITYRCQNKDLTEALTEIEITNPVSFFYDESLFKNEKISLNLINEPLYVFLNRLTRGKSYVYEIIQDNLVVFLPREKVASLTGQMVDLSKENKDLTVHVIGDPDKAGMYNTVTMKGIVRDGKTGNSLIGTTVRISHKTIGAITNLDGKYTLTLAPGLYTLEVSNVGYDPVSYKIKVISPGNFDIDLYENTILIDEISVYARSADKNIKGNLMGIVELDAKSIKELPSMSGEKDIIKSLTMMPGVKSIGEFGAGINVRGGGEDQNLYLVEGAPIFNTAHVFGLLSIINPDAVNSVTLYKGHIPSNYGERVSSVMDIGLKDQNGKEFQAKGGIGLFNSRLLVDVPIIKEKLTIKIGGRTSYSDWLLHQIPDYYLQNSSASFYDLNSIINLNLKKDHITLSGYSSYDNFKYIDELAYKYKNLLGSASWVHFFNSKFSSELLLAKSRYDLNKDQYDDLGKNSNIISDIDYSSAKFETKYLGIQKHSFNLGAQGIKYNINPGIQKPIGLSVVKNFTVPEENAFEYGFFVNDIYDVTKNISLNLGLRYSLYVYKGPRTISTYMPDHPLSDISIAGEKSYTKGETIVKYDGLEPRLSAKFLLSKTSSLKLSYNKNQQYISLISYSSIPTPDDVWKLADPFIKPITANQVAIGYYRNFAQNIFESSVEIYYKKLDNIQEYKNDAQINLNPNLERELINANGKNYGIECLIKKNTGKIEGWISYTYSRSLKKTNGRFVEERVNRNTEYPSIYDKPHDLTVVVTYHVNRRLRITGNFNFMSGRPVTLPEYIYQSGDEKIVYYSDRNKYRLPPYHRFDISFSLDENLKRKKMWKGSWEFSILNVYGRKNAYSVFYNKEVPKLSTGYKTYVFNKLYIIGVPLPVITYNFIF